MPITGDHPMHPFVIDAQGNLFVSMGSATNTCEIKNRMPHSKGNDPCVELETRAGIWRYDANKPGQVFSPGERYAIGQPQHRGHRFRHCRSLIHHAARPRPAARKLARALHAGQGFELPAEEVMIVKEGAWYGWPKCYFDPTQRKLVLAPEYGGDGGKQVGDCDKG